MSSTVRTLMHRCLLAGFAVALLAPLTAAAQEPRAVGDAATPIPVEPATASMEAQAADDEIPGLPLPASPVVGTLSYASDYNDVFAINLSAGETLSARVTGDGASDLDLYLYAPGSARLYPDAANIVAAAEAEKVNPDVMYGPNRRQFVATQPGTYYLDVAALDAPHDDSARTYTLEWAKGTDLPAIAVTSSSALTGYGAQVRFTGSVLAAGALPMSGARVELWARPYPYGTFVRRSTGVTSGEGAFEFSTTVDRSTRYTVIALPTVANHAFGESASLLVKSKPWLGAPRVKSGSKYRGKPFTVFGYLKPRHTSGAGHVTVTAYRGDAGVWKVARNVTHDSTTTKYETKIALPYRGTWKLVASTPDDGEHAATTSQPLYVKVK